jgi:hypothetical protein
VREIDIRGDLDSLVAQEFSGLHSGGGRSSIAGGQSAADQALAALDITGYAKRRSQVLPISSRGASVLSPYIRHNILTLRQVWNHVAKMSCCGKSIRVTCMPGLVSASSRISVLNNHGMRPVMAGPQVWHVLIQLLQS